MEQQPVSMDINITIDEQPRDTDVDHPSKEKIPLSLDKKFHIFFAYRDVQRDKLWVKKVIGKLETKYGYTCCDHERDFLPGSRIMDNIKYGLMNSEKVVVVFSKESIDSYYVSLEAAMAYQQSLEKRKNLVIPVLLDDCDVPEEYKLLTYIDAREGIEETTWWPKLLKTLQCTAETSRPQFHVQENSNAGNKTFVVNKLCSMETKYNYLRCRMQANSKYLPDALQPESLGVPGDVIRRTYKGLLQSPMVLCRQKCSLFASIWAVLWILGYVFSFFIFVQSVNACIEYPPCTIRAEFYFWVGFFIAVPICCIFGYKKCYLKNPSSVRKIVIEHNKTLSEYGVMLTVVNTWMWYRASLIFYTCKFELCKEYVIRHLAMEEKTGTTEYRDIPDRDQTQSVRNIEVINQVRAEETEDVADDEPLLSIEETENLDYENKALNMLLSCTPEYLTLAHTNQLKNPKEDRHGKDVTCLCQYLEKVDKDFRKKVKIMQCLRRKSNIEENDENNKHLKDISLY